jgi:hypothetical protein
VPQIGQGLVDGGMDGGSGFGFDLVCLEVWKAGGVVETCLTYSKSKRRRMEQCVCSLATVGSLTMLGCFFLFVCLECKVLDDASRKEMRWTTSRRAGHKNMTEVSVTED